MVRQLPNLLSLLRILMIPVFLRRYLTAATAEDFLVAGLILVLSGITDMADGFIARRFHAITDLGKVLDPVADKLTQFGVVVALWYLHRGLWPLLLLLFIKDVAMGVCGWFFYRRCGRVGQAKWYGKLATIVFYLVMVALVAFPQLLKQTMVWMLVTAVFGTMLFAGVMYGKAFYQEISLTGVKKG